MRHIFVRAGRRCAWGVLAEALSRHVPEQREALHLSFSLGDAAKLRQLFEAAGFREVRVTRESREGIIESFEEYWAPIETGPGQGRGIVTARSTVAPNSTCRGSAGCPSIPPMCARSSSRRGAGSRPAIPMVVAARKRLFGSWEMNWLAYNYSHDLALPGASQGKLAFLMYPQTETDEGRCDCLDADNFAYAIRARTLA